MNCVGTRTVMPEPTAVIDHAAQSRYSDPGTFASLFDEIEPTVESVSSMARNVVARARNASSTTATASDLCTGMQPVVVPRFSERRPLRGGPHNQDNATNLTRAGIQACQICCLIIVPGGGPVVGPRSTGRGTIPNAVPLTVGYALSAWSASFTTQRSSGAVSGPAL